MFLAPAEWDILDFAGFVFHFSGQTLMDDLTDVFLFAGSSFIRKPYLYTQNICHYEPRTTF